MLTPEQIAHFNTFGFLVMRQVFTPAEMAVIVREANEIMDEERGGRPFDGVKRQFVQPFFERKPFLSQLPADDRIYGLGESLLGPDFFLMGTEGNLHVGQTPWHGPLESSPLTIKIIFYLEALTKDTGALRLIPGSHLPTSPDNLQVLRDSNYDEDFKPFGVRPWEIPCLPLDSKPGDLVVFTEDVLHASFGGKPGRHQHVISFMANPENPGEVKYLRDLYSKIRYGLRPAETYVNSDNPRISRLVSTLVDLGFETIKG